MVFIKGLLFGMTLQLSVGPVCLAVLQKSITQGFKEAFKMVCAVTLVDAGYILASCLGMSNLLHIGIVRKIALFIGGFTLIYFGTTQIGEAIKDKGIKDPMNIQNKGSFGYGIQLTLVNPLTIVFWSGVLGSLIASGRISGFMQILLYSFGCIASTMLFLSLVSFGGNFISKVLNTTLVSWLNIIVGCGLIVFGIKMMVR